MVHVNDVSVREAKLARDTYRYIYFQHKTPLSATPLTSQQHKASYRGQQELYIS